MRCLPTPSSQGGEQCDAGQDQIDVASMEKILSQIGTSSKMPFRFTQPNRYTPYPLTISRCTQPQWLDMLLNSLKSNSGWGEGQSTPTFHSWNGSLIANILQEACPRDCMTEAVVLVPGKPILFFTRGLHNEGLLYRNAQHIEFSLRDPITWAEITAQVEATLHTMQEGCRAMADTIMGKKTKASRTGQDITKDQGEPPGPQLLPVTSMIGCETWMREHPMRSWEELMTFVLISRSEVALMLNTLVQVVDNIDERTLWVPRDFFTGSPSSGGRSSDKGSDQSSLHSTMTRTPRGSNRSACAGRGLWVKVNLPIFKDEKVKDMVTYHSWQCNVAIFLQSGWDDQHLLLYIFQSLQGFLGDLARSLGEDATLSNVLQMLDKLYGVIMTFDALSKELYSLKQGSNENVAEFSVHLSQQVQILQLEYPGRIQQEHMEEMRSDHFYEGLYPEYW